MHNYTRQVFKSLSSKEKRAYIDRLINSYVDMNKEELKAANKDQIKKYFDNKFNTRRTFEPEELQYLSFDQIKQFLARNNNMIELYILQHLERKQRKEVIEMIANSKFALDCDEIEQLNYSERKVYAKARINTKYAPLMRVFSVNYLDAKDQKKYVDLALSDGRSLSQEMIDVLKAPAKKHYEKLYHNRSANTRLTEAIKDRISIRF